MLSRLEHAKTLSFGLSFVMTSSNLYCNGNSLKRTCQLKFSVPQELIFFILLTTKHSNHNCLLLEHVFTIRRNS